ncbi:MAG TPA: TonB family protein [Rhodopila sp.]|jgi:protein TonB|nr:TonB family protein [Rhodopila sp.]
MSIVLPKPADGHRAWLRWGLSLGVVLAVHAGALMLLRRSVPAMGPAAPEAIMMDLAPEPAAPAQPALLPPVPAPPPTPAPPQPPSPPEPVPVPQAPPPDPVPLPIPDVAAPVPQAEIPLPPPRPPVPRPMRRPPPRAQPAEVRPAAPVVETRALPPVSVAAPPGPAASAPPGQVEATWEGRLLAHLARFKRFPPAAERRGEQGVVMMRLTISRGGQVLSMAMVRGSGYADLDAEARNWMERAQPLPAFPPDMTVQQMQVIVPLRFMLR